MEKQGIEWGKLIQTVNEMSKSGSEVLDTAQKWLMERCSEALKKRDETIAYVLESSVRKNAVPEIKGEITKGKIKWRGIKIYMEPNGNIFFKQRDRIISPKIRYDGTFADDDSIGLSVFPLNNWIKAEELIKEYEKNYDTSQF